MPTVYTQGPWTVAESNNKRAARKVVNSDGTLIVAQVNQWTPHADANADLIAAAPALLAALSELLAEADERALHDLVPMGNGTDYFPRRDDTAGEEMARQALAAAGM